MDNVPSCVGSFQASSNPESSSKNKITTAKYQSILELSCEMDNLIPGQIIGKNLYE